MAVVRQCPLEVLRGKGGVAGIVGRSGKVDWFAGLVGFHDGLLESLTSGFGVARLKERCPEIVAQAIAQARFSIVGKDGEAAGIGRRGVGVRFLAVQVVAAPSVPFAVWRPRPAGRCFELLHMLYGKRSGSGCFVLRTLCDRGGGCGLQQKKDSENGHDADTFQADPVRSVLRFVRRSGMDRSISNSNRASASGH